MGPMGGTIYITFMFTRKRTTLKKVVLRIAVLESRIRKKELLSIRSFKEDVIFFPRFSLPATKARLMSPFSFMARSFRLRSAV